MKMEKLELSVILYYIDNFFKKKYPELLNMLNLKYIDLNKLKELAYDNNVIYQLSKAVMETDEDKLGLKKYFSEEYWKHKEKLNQLIHAIILLKDMFDKEKINFLVIKTFRNELIPSNDLDILVKKSEVHKVEDLFKSKGAKVTGGKFINLLIKLGIGFAGYRLNNTIDIDPYRSIPWPAMPVINEEFLWQNPRIVKAGSLDFFVPSYEADLLIFLGSSLYTDRKLTLCDFLYLKNLLNEEKVDLDKLYKQTNLFLWNKGFKLILDILKQVEEDLYYTEDLKFSVNFPLHLPIKLLFDSLPGPAIKQIQAHPFAILNVIINIGFHCFIGELYNSIIKNV